MILITLRKYYEKIRNYIRKDDPDRNPSREGCWAEQEATENETIYERTLEKFAREHPDGIKLYDGVQHRTHRGGDSFDAPW